MHIFIGAALVDTSQAKVPTIVTDKEAMTMHAEADTFLSSMPQGLQDSQADAIIEAMAGYSEELRNVRQSRNTVHESSPDVEFVQIEGEGNARGIAMSLFKPEKPQPKPLPLFIGDRSYRAPYISGTRQRYGFDAIASNADNQCSKRYPLRSRERICSKISKCDAGGISGRRAPVYYGKRAVYSFWEGSENDCGFFDK